MGSPQSSRTSKKAAEDNDDTDRGPLRGALRRLGLWSGEAGPGPRAQTPIPSARTVRFESNAERHHLGFMQRYLRPGDVVLDIGAHSGERSLVAARLVGPPGRVDAFEPSPTLRTTLLDRIADASLKSVVVVHALMAGATAGLGRFVDGTSKSGRRRPPLPGELANRVLGIEQVRLDKFIGKRRYVLMCLDIAGCELNALRGTEAQLIHANPPALLVAFDPALSDFGGTPEIMADWLDDRGYELAVYDADRNMIDYPETPWRQRRIVLAIARTARNFVLKRLADTSNR
jgi:FkbM family methyltransferase